MIYIFVKFNFRARNEEQIAKTKIQRGDDSFTARGITVSTNTRSRQKNSNINIKSREERTLPNHIQAHSKDSDNSESSWVENDFSCLHIFDVLAAVVASVSCTPFQGQTIIRSTWPFLRNSVFLDTFRFELNDVFVVQIAGVVFLHFSFQVWINGPYNNSLLIFIVIFYSRAARLTNFWKTLTTLFELDAKALKEARR